MSSQPVAAADILLPARRRRVCGRACSARRPGAARPAADPCAAGVLGFAAALAAAPRRAVPRRLRCSAGLFGFGWFLAGLYWIGIAFYADAERFGALAIPAVLALARRFSACCRAWPACGRMEGAGAACGRQRLALRRRLDPGRAGSGRTGLQFPWNPVAIVWAVGCDAAERRLDRPTGWAWSPWPPPRMPARLLVDGQRRRAGCSAAGAAARARGSTPPGGAARLPASSGPTPVRLRIVQGNIAQDLKWDGPPRPTGSAAIWSSPLAAASRPDAVVWPETAVPYQLERDPPARDCRGAGGSGRRLCAGRRQPLRPRERPAARANNSLFAVDALGRDRRPLRQGRPGAVRRVPAVPRRARRLGLRKLTEGTLDFVPGPGRRRFRCPGLPPFSPLICYEAIFPTRASPEATAGLAAEHHQRCLVRPQQRPLPAPGHGPAADHRGRSAAGPRRQYRHLGGHRRLRPRPARLPLGEVGVIDAALPAALASPRRRYAAGACHHRGLWLLAIASSPLVEVHAQTACAEQRYRRPTDRIELSTTDARRPTPVDLHVGRRLKLRRSLVGMSQERLAELLGITYQQVQKYERGANRIGSSRLHDIARFLDVPVAWFFDGAGRAGGNRPGRGQRRLRFRQPGAAPAEPACDADVPRDAGTGPRLQPNRRSAGASAAVRAGKGAGRRRWRPAAGRTP